MADNKYIIYFRNGRYEVCNEMYRNLLYTYEIVESGIVSYSTAAMKADDLAFDLKYHTNYANR